MSSAEVFSWGALSTPITSSPETGEKQTAVKEEVVAPLEIARRFHVHQVFAGFGAAALGGDRRVEWIPKHSRPLRSDNGSNDFSPISNFIGVNSVAFGQDHALVLQTRIHEDENGPKGVGSGTTTSVLAYGSGHQGEVSGNYILLSRSWNLRECELPTTQNFETAVLTTLNGFEVLNCY